MSPKSETLLSFCKFLYTAFIYALYIIMYKLVSIMNIGVDMFMHWKHSLQGHCAYLGRIIWKRKLSEYHTVSSVDFISLFTTHVELEYVLRSNISLYSVSKNEAVFVETPENVNIYSSDENPFLYLAQYHRGINMIKMSIGNFHSLAETVGDPKAPVYWVSNIGRCGSTLLCQIFENVPGTLVLSEPDATLKICDLLSLNEVSETEFDDILRSTVRILCKPYPHAERIVVKTRSVCASLMSSLSYLFPKHVKQIFLYRNSLPSIVSWSPSMGVTPYGKVLRACVDNKTLSAIVPFFRKQFRFEIQCKLKKSRDIPLSNSYEQLVHMWANFMLVARDATSRDQSILPVKYEDIISNSQDIIKMIFVHLGLDLRYIDRALSALKRDSQRGSALSGARLRNDPRRHISVADRTIADDILLSHNLPLLGENFTL